MLMHPLPLVLFSAVCLAASAQPATSSGTKFGAQWQLLAGEWKRETAAGAGSGSCSFRFELGGHILLRTNHAELPSTGNRPAATHDDFMVIYPGATESQAQATYWDNEGHMIEYAATWSPDGNTLVFLSKPAPGPQFRLTYQKLDPDTFTVSFDMAAPGQAGAFKPYTSGRLRRQK